MKNVWIIVITLLLLLNAIAVLFLSGYITFQVPKKNAVTEPAVQLSPQIVLEEEPSIKIEADKSNNTELNVQEEPHTDTAATEETEPAETQNPTSNSNNESYIYFMTSDKIKEAISYGKLPYSGYDGTFSIPSQASTLDDVYFEDPYIRTPFYRVAQLSSVEYYDNDRTITEEEAWTVIDYNSISFSIQFMNQAANSFAVELSQNNIIEPEETRNFSSSVLKLVTYSTSNIDFNQPAVLRIFMKNDPLQYSDHIIDFSSYTDEILFP